MTAALEVGEWSAARPGRTIPPGKTRYPLYRRLDGLHDRSGRAEILVPNRIRSRTVQPVVSRYTDWSTQPLPYSFMVHFNIVFVSARNIFFFLVAPFLHVSPPKLCIYFYFTLTRYMPYLFCLSSVDLMSDIWWGVQQVYKIWKAGEISAENLSK